MNNNASAFAKANSFLEMNGMFYGMYNDMHMVVKDEGEWLSAYLYLDLPPAGRKARRDLENLMNEKGDRYLARVAPNSPSGFLKIEISKEDDACVNLDRFLTECDILLRPFGREMGLLCAYCRREMQDVKPEYKMENGLVVPVCPDCVNLESANKAKKGDNRRTIDQKRMMKGIIGAGIGCLISMVIWFFAGIGGSFFINIIAALASVFLIKWLFERLSKVPNRLTNVTVCVFAMFALIVGRAAGYTVNNNTYNKSMRESAEYLISFGQKEEMDVIQESLIEAYQNGDYDNVTIMAALMNPVFYTGIIVPAVAVLIASFGADSINLKSRKRR